MQVSQLINKRIAVVGLGITGLSCVRYLLRNGIQPVGFDTRTTLSINLDIAYHLGAIAETQLVEFDLILLSPGLSLELPAITTAMQAGIPVFGDIELFAWECDKPIIGITGSNGKSSVVSMLACIFDEADVNAAVGGNIGVPALDLLQQDFDVAVLELSSFQLETVNSLPLRVAAVLNVSEDHMDRYPDFRAYREAKQHIFDNADVKVANLSDQNTLPAHGVADIYINDQNSVDGFGLQHSPLSITLDGEPFVYASDMWVSGLHNLMNAQAAAIIAREMGVDDKAIIRALIRFKGLPHRCQKVSDWHNIDWVNDSKATNVGATIAAIEGLRPVVKGQLILLAGGDAKNADLSPLQHYLNRDVEQMITLGKDAQAFQAMKSGSQQAKDMDEAVNLAAKLANPGDMVLLSPACASLDMFNSFEQRGNAFVSAVEGLG